LRTTQQCRKEKLALQAKWDEEKAELQQSKEQLLVEQLEVKERVNRALRSVTIVEVQTEEQVPQQVAQLEEVIQKLQQRIADLELRVVPETPQEIRDQREATARSAVGRLKSLALECKKLSNQSAQTYENLTENPELQALESQLQEEKQHADTLQAQLKALSAVDRMKRSHEQCTHSATDSYDSKKSDGSHSTTSTYARQGMSVVYRGREPRSRARPGRPHSRTTPRRTGE
jgi:hypothetical protein